MIILSVIGAGNMKTIIYTEYTVYVGKNVSFFGIDLDMAIEAYKEAVKIWEFDRVSLVSKQIF